MVLRSVASAPICSKPVSGKLPVCRPTIQNHCIRCKVCAGYNDAHASHLMRWLIQHRCVFIAEPASTTVGQVRGILCRMCKVSANTACSGRG